MTLEGRTAVISGASGGIGSAVARVLHRCGMRLVLTGRNQRALHRLAVDLGPAHLPVAADIGTAEGRRAVVDAARSAGGCALLINSAGSLPAGLFADQTADSVAASLSINLVAPALLCHALLPLMQEEPEAAIVNVGSAFGSIGHPGFTAYCAAKFGLRGFSEALSRELADTGVVVYYLAPRATRTGFNGGCVDALNAALGNTVDPPEAVANALLRQLERGRRRAHLGWPEKFFVRINALLPGLVDSALAKKLPLVKQFLG